MKKLLLATFALVALGMASDAQAGCWRRGRAACPQECPQACPQPCPQECPQPVQTYKVVEDRCPAVPRCVKFVPTETNAICHRTCRWSCPPGYELQGYKEGHTFTLEGGSEQHSY